MMARKKKSLATSRSWLATPRSSSSHCGAKPLSSFGASMPMVSGMVRQRGSRKREMSGVMVFHMVKHCQPWLVRSSPVPKPGFWISSPSASHS